MRRCHVALREALPRGMAVRRCHVALRDREGRSGVGREEGDEEAAWALG